MKKGATTIWENWNGIDEGGNAHGSLNHYSYGAVGDWLYQVVAGLEIGTPGYKHIHFQPQPGGGFTEAHASYESLYGKIVSSWRIEDKQFALTVTVPANTTATVAIPVRLGRQVTESGHMLESVEGITGVKQEQEATRIEVGSGTYTFIVLSTDKVESE